MANQTLREICMNQILKIKDTILEDENNLSNTTKVIPLIPNSTNINSYNFPLSA